jgi:hypothetical protein
MKTLPNIDWLKNNHKLIHYFGLGFIQIKIDDALRLHFYTAELPPIVPEEDVHNHRYDFTSYILKGKFRQELYTATFGFTHLLEKETCKEGVVADAAPILCGLLLSSSHSYSEGDEYTIYHNTFHKVIASDCITAVSRSEYRKDLAEVVRPEGAPKVCPFSQKVNEGRLWEIVETMIKS